MALSFVAGLVLDAAILAVVWIALAGEFPGWGPLVSCVFAVGLASGVFRFLLPWPISLFGLVAGAGVGGLLIAWQAEIPLRRGLVAAGVYLGVRLVLTLALMGLFRG